MICIIKQLVSYMLQLLNPLFSSKKAKIWENELSVNSKNRDCFNTKHFRASKCGPGSIFLQENSTRLCQPSVASCSANAGRPNVGFSLECVKLTTDIFEERKAFQLTKTIKVLSKMNVFKVFEKDLDVFIRAFHRKQHCQNFLFGVDLVVIIKAC